MKEINDLNIPEDVRYAEDHEWVRADGDSGRIGISDFAQDQLGDIVFVELPAVGSRFERGAEFGTVESVKAVSELYMPVSGEVLGVNTALEDAPEQVNQQPYAEGWMIEVRMDDPAQMDELMDAGVYRQKLQAS
jgi:glycine cleavage system H protein